jgi:hypothetical protein
MPKVPDSNSLVYNNAGPHDTSTIVASDDYQCDCNQNGCKCAWWQQILMLQHREQSSELQSGLLWGTICVELWRMQTLYATESTKSNAVATVS